MLLENVFLAGSFLSSQWKCNLAHQLEVRQWVLNSFYNLDLGYWHPLPGTQHLKKKQASHCPKVGSLRPCNQENGTQLL